MSDSPKLLFDERRLTADELRAQPHASRLTLEEVLPLLQSPDSAKSLNRSGPHAISDGEHVYPVRGESPILYPRFVAREMNEHFELDLKYHADSRLQYFLLSQIKQHGEVNVPPTDIHYERHLFRVRQLVKDCEGVTLDVGCDDVTVSAALFSERCRYVGLDPFSRSAQPRVVGFGEFLPFKSESFDNVFFNTSLDHMLDHHQAIEEAFRVLKPGGLVLVCALTWTARATLLSDSVHFHHFRDYEIEGAVTSLGELVNKFDYSYKDSAHRYSKYLAVRKPAST